MGRRGTEGGGGGAFGKHLKVLGGPSCGTAARTQKGRRTMGSDSRNGTPHLTVLPPSPISQTKNERNTKRGTPPDPPVQSKQGPPLGPKVTSRKKKKKSVKQNKQKKYHNAQTNVSPGIGERERGKERREREKAAPPPQARANTVPKNGETGRKRGERERGEVRGMRGCECVCVCERERKRHGERRERERERNIKDCARSAWKDNRYST